MNCELESRLRQIFPLYEIFQLLLELLIRHSLLRGKNNNLPNEERETKIENDEQEIVKMKIISLTHKKRDCPLKILLLRMYGVVDNHTL